MDFERGCFRSKSTKKHSPSFSIGIFLTSDDLSGRCVQAAVTEKRGGGYQVDIGISHQARGHRVPEIAWGDICYPGLCGVFFNHAPNSVGFHRLMQA